MRNLVLACSAIALAAPTVAEAAALRVLPISSASVQSATTNSNGGRAYSVAQRTITGRPFSNGSAPGIPANRQQQFQTGPGNCITGDQVNVTGFNLQGALQIGEFDSLFRITTVNELGVYQPNDPNDIFKGGFFRGGRAPGFPAPAAPPQPGDPVNTTANCYLQIAHPEDIFVTRFATARFQPASTVRYFGFMLGSLDEYNNISVRDLDSDPVPLGLQDENGNWVAPERDGWNGAEIATALGLPLYQDYWVELRFDAAVFEISLNTTNWALEIDSVVTSNNRNVDCIYSTNPATTIWSRTCVNVAPTLGSLLPPGNISNLPGQLGIADDVIRQQQQVPAPAGALLLGAFGLAIAARRRVRA